MTHYPSRRRKNPWFKRFLAGAGVLAVGLAWWLWWDPPLKQTPEELMGYGHRSALPTTATAGTNDGAQTTPSSSTNPNHSNHTTSALVPKSLAARLATPTPPARQFKPNPSLIVPPAPSDQWPARPAQTTLEAQIALARQGLSPGSIDGLNGPKTRRALRAFQELEGLPVTGQLDQQTKSHLLLTEPPFTQHHVTTQDLSRLNPVPSSWLGKSRLPRLDYETLVELVSERWQAHPALVRQLNQDRQWSRTPVGARLTVPNVRQPTVRAQASSVRIGLGDRILEVFDAATNRVALFPCTIARQMQDRLVGRLQVASIVRNPDYTFDPKRFRQTAEVRQIHDRLAIPPGPNNPVGTVWIGLNRPGYGIHGTPHPEKVGEAASLGCFRLTNWSAELLTLLAWEGMPVDIEP